MRCVNWVRYRKVKMIVGKIIPENRGWSFTFKMDRIYGTQPPQKDDVISVNAQVSDQTRRESLLGVVSATTAFLIWGLTVFYFKAIRAVPAIEILMHRIVWSCLFLLLLVLILKKWPEFKELADLSCWSPMRV